MHRAVHGEGDQESVVVDREKTGDIALVGHPILNPTRKALHGVAVLHLADALVTGKVPRTDGVIASAWLMRGRQAYLRRWWSRRMKRTVC